MGFFSFLRSRKFKFSVKNNRGAIDANAIVEVLKDSWDELQDVFDQLDDDEKDQVRFHFNDFIPGEGDLGDILFGSKEEFDARVGYLDADLTKEYTDELIK